MTNKQPNTILIADDHPLILMGLQQALSQIDNLQIIEKCDDGQKAYERIQALQPQIAILDIQMPGLNGLEIAELVQTEKINTNIIILTMFHDLSFFEKAKQLNVKGYLLKDSMLDEIENCVESILAGKDYFSNSMKILTDKRGHKLAELNDLTRMEKKVFQLIGEQKSSKEIAALLFLSSKTIDNHRYNICKKLDIGGGSNALLKFAMEFTNR